MQTGSANPYDNAGADGDHHDHAPPADNRHKLNHWRCPNCGQMVFNEGESPPPDWCAYCADLTTWKKIKDGDEAKE